MKLQSTLCVTSAANSKHCKSWPQDACVRMCLNVRAKNTNVHLKFGNDLLFGTYVRQLGSPDSLHF